jgi:hypothetical protein
MHPAGANDSHSSGQCVCENCRAWDHPRGLLVGASAYGPTMSPPVEARLAENTVLRYVGHFPLTTESSREEQKAPWMEWVKTAPHMFYRPNLWYWGGGLWGWPEVAMTKTAEDFRFLAENRCWTMMEEARDALMAAPELRIGSRYRLTVTAAAEQVDTPEFLRRGDNLLQQAAAKVAAEPDVYSQRVAFVRAGFDVFRLMIENIPPMKRVRDSGGKDADAVRQARSNWETMALVSVN